MASKLRLWMLRLAFCLSVASAVAVLSSPVWAPQSNHLFVMLSAFSSGWAVMSIGRRLWYWQG